MQCMISTNEYSNIQISIYALMLIFSKLIFIFDYSESTVNSHVKANMVHILHRIKAIGLQPLESFKDMLTRKNSRSANQIQCVERLSTH